MSKNKFYAVRKGRTPGIYKTWNECKEQTAGYPGAEFKGFETEPEAREYLMGNLSLSNTHPLPEGRNLIPETNKETAIAYVDGSYDNKTKRYAYGCIIFHNGNVRNYSKAYEHNPATSMRNVAGEITGSLVAMKWCIKNNIKHLHLYYDYEGIEKWCTGEWKTKNPHTQKYKTIYDQYTTENGLIVTFHKIKGHSGNEYNEKADKLAKAALGI